MKMERSVVDTTGKEPVSFMVKKVKLQIQS